MNNRAPDLSPEARRIINAARGADDPTADDQTRVKTRWLAGVAAVAGVSSLTEAARAAGGVGWGLKAVGAAVAIVAGAIGLYVAVPNDGATVGTGVGHERHEKTVASDAREPASEARAARARQTAELAGAEVGSAERDAREVAASPGAAPSPGAGPSPGAAPSPGAGPTTNLPAASPSGEGEVLARAPELSADPPAAAEPVPSEPAASPTLDVLADRPATDVSARTARERAVASRAQARPSGTRAAPVVAAPAPAAAPAAPVPAEASAPPAVAAGEAASASGQLGEELGLLSQVRSSVQDGAPQRALELLADYEARFGQPILEMEADALRVDALCRAGQREAARASAAAFQNEWPGSPLGSRVSAACP